MGEIKTLDATVNKASDDDAARREHLTQCIANANATYESNIMSNGSKTGKGTYSVPLAAEAEFRRQKQDKIEECKLLYLR